MYIVIIIFCVDYDLCTDCGAQLTKREYKTSKNKRSQRHICPKKSELGAQAVPSSDFEDSMASFDLSQMPARD